MADSAPSPGRYAPFAVLAVTLLVFAGVVAYIGLWLRTGLREQVLRREAETLTEIARFQLATEADVLRETLKELGLENAPGELLNAVLKTSKLRGVFAVRVLDDEQRLIGALPIPWSDLPPAAEDWRQLRSGEPLARLHPRESAAEVIGMAPTTSSERDAEPLLETWLPLHTGENGTFAGAAQLWTDGRAVATEFAALDRRLLRQAVLAWVAGASIISAVLGWAFLRLSRANRELRARSEDLLRANRELSLAAKTSALGAVTAHLMHELKNPVSGLEEFVASQSEPGARGDIEGELVAASELTRRLRTMINDVASVIRDEQTGIQFELTCGEIAGLALEKVSAIAKARGVRLESSIESVECLSARRANLVGLVLQNLLQNAVEASPPAGVVQLKARTDARSILFSVSDQGGGVSPAVLERLFHPCASTKRGGSGIGLALSQHLARQAAGRIELVRSTRQGACFQLVLDAEPQT